MSPLRTWLSLAATAARVRACGILGLVFILVEARAANLTLNVPFSGVEGSTVAGRVSWDEGTNHPPITVYLVSGNTNRAAVAAAVMIPAGESSTAFDLVLVNNDWIEPGTNVLIEAWLDDFTGDLDVLRVDDDESRTPALALPPQAYEAQGPMVNGGTISLAGRTTTNVVLSLVSDRPQLMAVPALVTNLAGASNASFTLTCNNVGMTNTFEVVRIRVSGPGFLATTSTVTVLDRARSLEPAHPSPVNFFPYEPSTGARLSWTTSTNTPAGAVYDVYFGTTANPTTLVGSTSSNLWPLPLLDPATIYYWRVVTHSAVTVAGPVWQFTTRGMAYMRMSPVASPQVVGVPFSVTVSAWDELNRPVPNFTGPVGLSVVVSTQFFTETILSAAPVNTESATGNYSVGYEFIPSTNITVTALRSKFGGTASLWNQAGTLLASRNMGNVGSWSETALLTPIQLTAGQRYKVSGSGTTHYWTTDAPPTFPHGVITQSYKTPGTGIQPINPDPARWFLVDLRYKVGFSANPSSPITPTNSANFTGGAWTGSVTPWDPNTTFQLRATPPIPPVGPSTPILGNTFLVLATNQPPIITTNPASAQTTRGAFTNFSVAVLATPPTAYQWRRNGVDLLDNGRISGATSATLVIQAAMESDAGLYSVFVSNAFGTILSSNASLAVSAGFDSDGDGANNQEEFLAGTDPTDALSVLKMKIILSATNQATLTFVAQSNRSYSVQWRTNVLIPTWQNLTNITAAPFVRTVLVDAATAPAAERYFRVVTPQTP